MSKHQSLWNVEIEVCDLPSCSYFNSGSHYALCKKCINHPQCIELLTELETQKTLQEDLHIEQLEQM